MKVKVKQTYRDKITGKIVYAGSVLEMNEERINEINSVGERKYGTFVEMVKEDKPQQEEEKNEPEGGETESGSPEENSQIENTDLHSMEYSELQKMAKKYGVSAKGSKENLIERIYQAEETGEE